MIRALEVRKERQGEMLGTARDYVNVLRTRIAIERAWVVGSVARGDFNLWSDIDVLIVATDLPARLLDRLNLFLDAPSRVQVSSLTPPEFDLALERGNPMVVEALELGRPLLAISSASQSARSSALNAGGDR